VIVSIPVPVTRVCAPGFRRRNQSHPHHSTVGTVVPIQVDRQVHSGIGPRGAYGVPGVWMARRVYRDGEETARGVATSVGQRGTACDRVIGLNGTHMTEAREPSRILHGSMVKSLRARGQSLPPVGTYNQAPGWVSLLQLYGPADPSDLLGSQDAYRL